MNNQQYWANRLNEIAQHRFDLTNEIMQKELKAMYDEVASKIQSKVEELYFKMLEEGNLKRSEIWTYKHYRDLEKQLNAEMVKLGNKEVKLLNGNLEWVLEEIYKDTGIIPYADKFAVLSKSMVKAIVNRPWAAQHFRSTIWKNKELLAQQLKKGITECIITGKNKDKLVEAVMKKMNTGFSNADRVVRTELMHTINQGQVQRYKDTGYTKLVWNTAFDSRTCDDCAHLDGKVVDVDSVDIPPVHARCRCTICPLLESIGDAPQTTIVPHESEAEINYKNACKQVLDRGKINGNENLLLLNLNGEQVFDRLDGTNNCVRFTPEFNDFIDNSIKESLMLIHNHPKSSSFSDADMCVLNVYDSIKEITAYGHDGTLYRLSTNGNNIGVLDIKAEYRHYRNKYQSKYSDKVIRGELTPEEAWKEHSNEIIEEMSKLHGWTYTRGVL